jgi:hypothetical protein
MAVRLISIWAQTYSKSMAGMVRLWRALRGLSSMTTPCMTDESFGTVFRNVRLYDFSYLALKI